MPTPILISGEDIMLDALLAEKFGAVAGRDLVMATLALNPGLADAGPFLPEGRTILLPDPPTSTGAARVVVSLFG